MRNRSFSGWRQFVLYAVVVSFALTPVFAGGKDRVTSAVGNPQTTGGLQQVDDNSQPTADNLEPAKLYARSNYLWPYGIPTPYGTVNRDQLNDQGILRTMVGTLQVANLQVSLPAELQTANKLDALGMQYFIVDLNHAWLRDGGAAKISDVIAAAGGEVVGGMPVSAVIARLTQGALTEVQAQPGVNAVVAFPSALKLHPSIGQLALANPIKAVSEVYSLDITIFPGENGRAVASQIIALGGEVTVVAGTPTSRRSPRSTRRTRIPRSLKKRPSRCKPAVSKAAGRSDRTTSPV